MEAAAPKCTHTPMHDVAPSAVKIAVIMLANICSVHFNVSFFPMFVKLKIEN